MASSSYKKYVRGAGCSRGRPRGITWAAKWQLHDSSLTAPQTRRTWVRGAGASQGSKLDFCGPRPRRTPLLLPPPISPRWPGTGCRRKPARRLWIPVNSAGWAGGAGPEVGRRRKSVLGEPAFPLYLYAIALARRSGWWEGPCACAVERGDRPSGLWLTLSYPSAPGGGATGRVGNGSYGDFKKTEVQERDRAPRNSSAVFGLRTCVLFY